MGSETHVLRVSVEDLRSSAARLESLLDSGMSPEIRAALMRAIASRLKRIQNELDGTAETLLGQKIHRGLHL